MTERRKVPRQSSHWFVEALFELPLAARQVLVTKYHLPLAPEELVLPTDHEQSIAQLANTIVIEPDETATPDGNRPNTTEFTTTVLSSEDAFEADALRALMGYGRLARRKDGSHEC